MIKELIKFTAELFPSISPYTKDSVMNAINQFNYDELEWFTPTILKELSQGDIIDKLPFTYYEDNGQKTTVMKKGIILSNSCDVDNDKYILIAPLFDYNTMPELDSKTIRSNKYYDKMCFTNSQLDNYLIDFSRTNSFNKKTILNAIQNGKAKRIYSLNQYGYYLLLIKLTVYLMRSEDNDTNTERNDHYATIPS